MATKTNEEFDIKKYGWSRIFPWTKEGKRYRRNYEKDIVQDLSESEKIRYSQGRMIYGTDILLFSILTTLWTILPQYIDFKGFWEFVNLGLKQSDSGWDWAQSLMFFLIPGTASTGIHLAPKVIPFRKGRIVADSVLKIVPIILLTICWYLISTEIKYKSMRKLEGDLKIKQLIGE